MQEAIYLWHRNDASYKADLALEPTNFLLEDAFNLSLRKWQPAQGPGSLSTLLRIQSDFLLCAIGLSTQLLILEYFCDRMHNAQWIKIPSSGAYNLGWDVGQESKLEDREHIFASLQAKESQQGKCEKGVSGALALWVGFQEKLKTKTYTGYRSM